MDFKLDNLQTNILTYNLLGIHTLGKDPNIKKKKKSQDVPRKITLK